MWQKRSMLVNISWLLDFQFRFLCSKKCHVTKFFEKFESKSFEHFYFFFFCCCENIAVGSLFLIGLFLSLLLSFLPLLAHSLFFSFSSLSFWKSPQRFFFHYQKYRMNDNNNNLINYAITVTYHDTLRWRLYQIE